MTLKKKIMSFSLIYMLLIIVCVILSDWSFHKILVGRNEARAALDIQERFQDLRISFEQTLMGPHDYLILGIKEEREIVKEDFKKLYQKKENLKKLIASKKKNHSLAFEKALEEGEKRFEDIEKKLPGFEKIAVDILNLDNPFGNSWAGHYMKEMDSLVRGLEKELQSESELLTELSRSAVLNADQIHNRFQTFITIIGIFAVLVGFVLSYYVIKSITTPVEDLIHATRKIIGGDLTARANAATKDEIGELASSFNKMVKELIIAQERIYSIFQGTGDAMRVIDRDFNVLEVNKEMEILMGATSSASVSKKCYEQFYGEFCHTEKCSLLRIIKGEERIESETCKKTKIGEMIPVELIATPLRREGKIVGVIESFRNITKRWLAENALKENELRLKTILNSVQIGILIIDRETHKIFDCNPIAVEMIQSPKDKVIGAEHNEYILYSKMISHEENQECYECLLKRANNEVIPIIKSQSCVVLKGREYILESFIDITERKRVEEAIQQTKVARAERERLFSVLEVLPALVYLQASDYSIPFANRKFRETFGDPNGKPCYEILHGRKYPCEECITFQVFKGKEVIQREWNNANGKTYEFYDCPFTDIDGSPLALELGIDITERKMAENATKEAERKLEEQRARAILSDRLRSLGEMASGMAHELNQPLLGVRGLAEHIQIALSRGWDFTSETLREKIRLIIEQADRMSHVIEHARMFARGANTSELLPVQVNEVIMSGISLIGTQLRSKGLQLKCELSDDLPDVLANPFSLEEVILNLINNSRDAMEQAMTDAVSDDSFHIFIKTSRHTKDSKEYVKIEVIDRGGGIPEEIVQKIFEPFFTTKDPEKGTGLGLSISKSIIEGFNGTIDIQSSSGVSTTVTILLPGMIKMKVRR